MNTSILEEELAPLNAQIEHVRRRQEDLERQLRAVEAELDTFSSDRKRFEALQEVCQALDKLAGLEAENLFWDGIADAGEAAEHVQRSRKRIVTFEGELSGILEAQAKFQKQVNHCLEELSILYEEVRDAYDREERRKEEYVVERDISSVPYREMVMPWTKEGDSERRFRQAVLLALLLCLVIGIPISMISLPIPDRSVTVVEIPERLVQLVRKEEPARAPAPKPEPKPVSEEEKEEAELAKAEPEKAKEETKPSPDEKRSETPPQETADLKKEEAGGGGAEEVARKKAEAVGVLAFKDAFKDLMKETPVAKLGTEARLTKDSPQIAGTAMAHRSLVSIQAQGGSSGGIASAQVSRNIGNGNVDRLGGIGIGMNGGSGGGSGGGHGGGKGTGVGIGRVSSSIANLEESSRPVSDGLPPARTDEEIQIVFDRYKAALYRIYNRELRKDPTLRGKILMRIAIEPTGEVSLCEVESTDLASDELVARIVERIRGFNFGPKDGVQQMTILYPIDFLPAG